MGYFTTTPPPHMFPRELRKYLLILFIPKLFSMSSCQISICESNYFYGVLEALVLTSLSPP